MIFNVLAFLPEILILCAVFFLMGRAIIVKEDARQTLPKTLTQGIGISALFLLLSHLCYMWFADPFHGTYGNGFFLLNRLTLLAKGLTLLVGFLSLNFKTTSAFSSNPHRQGEAQRILVLLCLLGSCLLISSYDFLSFYMSMALQMIPLYAIIALRKKSTHALDASFKYLVFGTVSGAFMLYGIGLLYGYMGGTNFSNLHYASYALTKNIYGTPWFYGGILMILAGLCFKIAAFPFHGWVADIYEGCSNRDLPLIALVPKISILVVLLYLLRGPLNSLHDFTGPLLLWTGSLSILFGALLTLPQNHIRRFLACASIGQGGFILLAYGSGTLEGFRAALLSLILYVVGFLILTHVLMLLKKGEDHITFISDLKGLWNSSPFLSACTGIALLSFAGLPPLAGFWAKFYIFMAALQKGAYGPVLVGALGTILSLYYYLKIAKEVFFEEGKREPLGLSLGIKATFFSVTLLLILFPFIQEPLLNFLTQTLR